MFGLLGSSQKLLDVLSDLLRLTDDVLCARQGSILLALLPLVGCFRGSKRAATSKNRKLTTDLLTGVLRKEPTKQ